MRRRRLLCVALALAAFPATGAAPGVSRADLSALERKFDERIEGRYIDDSLVLLGNTRGVYLQDYGVVFTSEVNLVAMPLSPFRPKLTTAQIGQLRVKKLARLQVVKKLMRGMMVDCATALRSLPAGQRIAVGMTLFHFDWEDSRGIPAQVLMEARRQSLVDFESGKLDQTGLELAIRVQEF